MEKLQTYLTFYNNERFQSRLRNLSPVDYRLKMAGN
ncbi:MAG: IS3 family transposase [Peptococcaceae bacterium]|nr:IS3 family transposase [Peptococcaceae bacterium]